ncbi:uncharacterized protein ACR2FA_007705 [Aphomia sociella]
MEFFGLTLYGPQNYIKDSMREEYQEPYSKDEVKPLMQKIEMYSTMPKQYGWWQHDPEIALSTWSNTHPRYPQPMSPNTLTLDKVRKNNKYATLF